MEKVSTFQERLRTAINIRGYSQKHLSDLTGISKSLISRYLRGDFEANGRRLYLLSNALHVSATWLMGLDFPMEEEPILVEQNRRQKINQFINDMDDNSFDKLEDFLVKFFDYKK